MVLFSLSLFLRQYGPIIGVLRDVGVVGSDGKWRSLAHEKSMRKVGLATKVGGVVGEFSATSGAFEIRQRSAWG